MKIAVLSKFQPVPGAVKHQTAWDSSTKRYRVIGPNKNLWEPTFISRRTAESFALKIAQVVFRKKDAPVFEKRKQTMLGNELLAAFNSMDFQEIDTKHAFDFSAQPSDRPKDNEEDL